MLHVFPRSRLSSSFSLLPLRSAHKFYHHDHDLNSTSILLSRCSTRRHADQIHAQLLHLNPSSSSFLFAGLVSLYSRLGLLRHSLSVFLSTPHQTRTSLLWNSILRAHLSHHSPTSVISLFKQMPSSLADAFTFPLLIRASSLLGNQNLCFSIHAHVVVTGFYSHLHVSNELVSMHGNLSRMDIACKVFDGMPLRNVVSWNVLISGFASNRDCEGAQEFFHKMQMTGIVPNPVTWTSLLSAHARCQRHREVVGIFDEMRAGGTESTAEAAAVALSVCAYVADEGLAMGRKIHGFAVRIGFENYRFVRNSLICMYGKLGNTEDSKRIFSDAEVRDLVSWNALISSYVAAGLCDEAYEVFSEMERLGQVVPNVVTWSAVIGGFASAGLMESSLSVFRRMQLANMQPNAITIATVLSSCSELSALGKEIHCHAIKTLMDGNILVGNGLLNMYTKSGNLAKGHLVFNMIKEKDLISWNTMITGFGMHGFCNEALDTFNDMLRSGLKPDGITFVAALSACSHAGHVEVGRHIFNRMMNEYKLTPAMEHYSCMVDLLGRAGLLKEAIALVEGMPVRPNACVLGALLNACRLYGNITLAEDCVSRVLGLEGEITGNYMLLSNIYASSGKWQESAKMRVLSKSRGFRKQLGQSWIELKKKVFAFSSGSSLPLETKEVYEVLNDLGRHMDNENFVSKDWNIVGSFEGNLEKMSI